MFMKNVWRCGLKKTIMISAQYANTSLFKNNCKNVSIRFVLEQK